MFNEIWIDFYLVAWLKKRDFSIGLSLTYFFNEKIKIRKSQFVDHLNVLPSSHFVDLSASYILLCFKFCYIFHEKKWMFLHTYYFVCIICPEMVLNRHWMEKFMFMSNNSLLIPKSTRYNFLSIGSEWMKNWVCIDWTARNFVIFSTWYILWVL